MPEHHRGLTFSAPVSFARAHSQPFTTARPVGTAGTTGLPSQPGASAAGDARSQVFRPSQHVARQGACKTVPPVSRRSDVLERPAII